MTAFQFTHREFGELDSTNAEARRFAQKGEGGPMWISAQSQTHGRGRRGRDWVSETGNLFTTFLITVPVAPAIAAQVSFVAALAIYQVSNDLLSTHNDLQLKWPNDVLLDGKKLAGILLETLPCVDKNTTVLAIGCGVNLQHAPNLTDSDTTWLNAHCSGLVTPNEFLKALAEAMDNTMAIWRHGKGFAQIVEQWQYRCVHIGKTVSLTTGDETVTGIFVRLALDGALVLELEDGEQRLYHAGDVSLRSRSIDAR